MEKCDLGKCHNYHACLSRIRGYSDNVVPEECTMEVIMSSKEDYKRKAVWPTWTSRLDPESVAYLFLTEVGKH